MIILFKDNAFKIKWQLLKGSSNVKENFHRSKGTWLWFVSARNRIPCSDFTYDEESGQLIISVPSGLDAGVYGLKLIWQKNHLGDPTSLTYAEVDGLFTITDIESEATQEGTGIVISLTSRTSGYGNDGLDAYELAVMRGLTADDELTWLKMIHTQIDMDEKYEVLVNILNKCNFDYAYKVLTYAEYKVIAHDPKTIYFITDQITDDI